MIINLIPGVPVRNFYGGGGKRTRTSASTSKSRLLSSTAPPPGRDGMDISIRFNLIRFDSN